MKKKRILNNINNIFLPCRIGHNMSYVTLLDRSICNNLRFNDLMMVKRLVLNDFLLPIV